MKSPVGELVRSVRNQASPVRYSVNGNLLSRTLPPKGVTAALGSTASVGTMFGIINRLSNATAHVEWKLYRKTTDGRKRYGPTEDNRTEVVDALPLRIWNRPNDFMTRQELVESVQQHIDLTGEGWLVYDLNSAGWPQSIWYVRPDRIEPVPSPTDFLAGYIYTGPNGEKVPLSVQQVSQIRMPNPMDMYRGLSPVLSLLTTMDAVKYAQEWNRNFFVNNADPGGLVQATEALGDEEFDRFQERWREAHQGVRNAHRVAILEGGMTWVDRSVSQKDMQFVQLRTESRDEMLEAFGMPKSVLGITEDVNRASAEAGEVTFGRWLVVPRLERWKSMLNNDYLPLFGPAAANLEFDYEPPIPPDQNQDNLNITNQVTNYIALVGAGVNPEEAAEFLGLPPFTVEKPEPPPQLDPGVSGESASMPPDGANADDTAALEGAST